VFNGKAISGFRDSVLWQETGTGVTFNTSLTNGSPVSQQYITVTAIVPTSASNKYANAVIALTWKNEGAIGPVGSDEPYEVVWSWHIWAMPETGATGYSSGGDVNGDFHNPNLPLLMKRVLGKGVAAHQGLHYQWGRKDPFFRELSGISPAIFYAPDVALVDNKENATRHPSTFYKGTSASAYDWMGTAHDNTLWSASLTPATKTFYDPCPEGWRVPPQYTNVATSPWQNDVNIVRAEYGNGRISSGNAAGVATGGYLWTATTNGNQSYYTTVPAAGTITHNVAAERASGLSVRCVKDLERKY
jgi:hypothetical protein